MKDPHALLVTLSQNATKVENLPNLREAGHADKALCNHRGIRLVTIWPCAEHSLAEDGRVFVGRGRGLTAGSAVYLTAELRAPGLRRWELIEVPRRFSHRPTELEPFFKHQKQSFIPTAAHILEVFVPDFGTETEHQRI
ncbi:hypothetical protein EYF80_020794 [Liparis tanakae]|uniref:Uncharacterized protein n=1 Tax=Liparis tanakae TaxID=230148 RepID=A0A4Z2HVE2_9TELE|nr:hypothetical protein EYF80_020794 [Liparis tanakae]